MHSSWRSPSEHSLELDPFYFWIFCIIHFCLAIIWLLILAVISSLGQNYYFRDVYTFLSTWRKIIWWSHLHDLTSLSGFSMVKYHLIPGFTPNGEGKYPQSSKGTFVLSRINRVAIWSRFLITTTKRKASSRRQILKFLRRLEKCHHRSKLISCLSKNLRRLRTMDHQPPASFSTCLRV